MRRDIFYCTGSILICLVILGLAGCKPAPAPAVPVTTAAPGTTEAATGTAPGATLAPSTTSIPLAARVNGLEISLAEYQSELAMYQAAKGTELAPEDKKRVLDDLIDQALLAQAAQEKSFIVDQAMLQERIKQLASKSGGDQALQTWLATYRYDEQSFQRALARSIGAAWMRDQIAAATPPTAEQVHARQILLYTAVKADEIYQQLKAGNDFGNLALKYDPLTGGDLGWFPRGYLPDKQLEQVAFSLQPEQFSAVIESPAGFHILQLLERDSQHPLLPDAWLALQTQAVMDWLSQRRSQSQIEIMVP
jgi:peptidyl-prolyl cis-trans isomerase C